MTSVRHTDRDPVLDAARDSVLAVGWRRTSLAEVARRAGVSRMTIYRRWPDMTALFGDLMTREWADVLAGLDSSEDRLSRRDIARAVVDLVRLLRADELFGRMLEVDPELLLPYLLERRGRSQQLVLDLLVPLLRQGQRRGEVRRGNVHALARSVVLAAHGFGLSAETMVDHQVSVAILDRELLALVERYLAP
ncbi:TetR/AcrR family transcriptional regulator [Nocardioides mangrovicus]|uniref:TetR/AcrR family transcriptional regulator n=1 Tax=Nocardioides mangrovicus TaxID=2478913 RepID=A0A3L8NZR3_9ACTN|nr:TetR/AcrR family transcriptional regulator [Nocardioides mangrovicus]RLV48152.1 TetR/AcrR family transcriptional regulator [Nocardioides mangrovicus]